MGMSAHQRIRRIMAEKKKDKLKHENPTIDFEKMTTTDLKEYAKAKNINISGLTKKDDIKTRILDVISTNSDSISTNSDSISNDNEISDMAESNVQDNLENAASEERADDNGADGGTA